MTTERTTVRPATERVMLGEIDEHVQALKNALEGLDMATVDRLSMAKANLPGLRRKLEQLDRALTIAQRALNGRESRGAPEKPPGRRNALGILAGVFQEHEGGAPEDYRERLRDFLVQTCGFIALTLPREDRVLELLDPSVKVPRSAP